jgi:molybdenum cofactor synthesis domain-containing protein
LSGETKQWTAALVVIGDEILSGRTQDQNVEQLAVWLNEQGIRLSEVRVVADDVAHIAQDVNALRVTHDYLFTTGGIGPTHDDITVDAIAAAFGVPVVVHPEARQILEDYYRDRPGGLTSARLRMARMPAGAELIPNGTSGAPGVRMANVHILAGVPYIAAAMLEALDGKLKGGRPMVSVTVGARAPESDVADLLRETEADNPGVAIGSYPFFKEGGYGANFVIRSEDADLARRTGSQLSERLRDAGYEPVEGGL